MTHLSARAAALVSAICLALASAAQAQAQCCATPTVAYAPVVAAPATVVAAPRLGFFDRLRLRRWGLTTPVVAAPAYSAAYAPAYTAAYAPSYSTYYAPAYTAAYAPAPTAYLTSYAPLQRPVVATAYYPAATVDPCSTCATPSYGVSYAPTAVLSPACSPCTTCAAYPAEAPCSSCATTSTSSYVQAATIPDCNCAEGGGQVIYSTPGGAAGSSSSDPTTPTPEIPEAAPVESGYTPEAGGGAGAGLQAPDLLRPMNDQTARGPSVDVRTAVYRRPVGAARVSAAGRPARTAVDSGAWTATVGK